MIQYRACMMIDTHCAVLGIAIRSSNPLGDNDVAFLLHDTAAEFLKTNDGKSEAKGKEATGNFYERLTINFWIGYVPK